MRKILPLLAVTAAFVLAGCKPEAPPPADMKAQCQQFGTHFVARRKARAPQMAISNVRFAYSEKLRTCVCSYDVAAQSGGRGHVISNTVSGKDIAAWGGPPGQEWGTPGARSEAEFNALAKSLGLRP